MPSDKSESTVQNRHHSSALILAATCLLLFLFLSALRYGVPPHASGDSNPTQESVSWTAEVAATHLAALPPEERFAHTFAYGEVIGATRSLAEVAHRGTQLPEMLRAPYYDGVGHGFTPDTTSTTDTVASIRDNIPAEYAGALHDGVVLHHTQSVAHDPASALAFAEAYGTAAGMPDILNGLRIGVQRANRRDLSAALALAARYPETTWPALYEELGWLSARYRAGHTREEAAAISLVGNDTYWAGVHHYVVEHAAAVPNALRCHYFHGAIRGRVLRHPWKTSAQWGRIQEEIDGFDDKCRETAFQGVAWALFILSNHDPSRAVDQIERIEDPNGQRIVTNTLTAIQNSLSSSSGPPLPPWELSLNR